MTAALFVFSRAAQPTGDLQKLKLPRHAQVVCLEVIASHYANRVKSLIGHDRETIRKRENIAADMAVVLTRALSELQKCGIFMFPKKILPAELYAAALCEVLGEGLTDECPWRHKDAYKGFLLAQTARKLDVMQIAPIDMGADKSKLVFIRQFSLLFALERDLKSAKNLPPQDATALLEFTPFREATQTRWPASPLSVQVAIAATRLRHTVSARLGEPTSRIA